MINNNYTKKPTRGLVASYPLDGSATGAVNVSWVKTDKGYQSQCGSFDGSSSYVGITRTTTIEPNEITVSCFIYLYSNVSGSGLSSVIDHGNANLGYGLTIHGSNYGGQDNEIAFNIGNGSSNINAWSDTSLELNKWYHIVGKFSGGVNYIYINGELKGTGNISSLVNDTAYNLYIGRYAPTATRFFNGLIQNVDIYNVALTEDEIRNLYLEGERQLGNNASYPKLLNGLVGYFRAEDVGGTTLYNLANGITATRVSGTNTTDNLGNNQAISNPNYTWSSLTYTTGYTFENSGSGWSIVTSPTGLNTTGINRTTTLRDIFLFNRTLSANEVIQLQDLCNKEIIYPSKVYDLPNLRDGLVLEYMGSNNGNTTIYDTSGDGKNGTVSSTPTYKRQGRITTISLSSQSISWASTSFITSICFEKISGVWTLVMNPSYITTTGVTSGTREITGIRLYNRTITTSEQQQYFYSKKANFIY